VGVIETPHHFLQALAIKPELIFAEQAMELMQQRINVERFSKKCVVEGLDAMQ
jgi:ATP adenylyltransferase/5',5'''-P-1,P-4-tetraphosphate phosphorylase II